MKLQTRFLVATASAFLTVLPVIAQRTATTVVTIAPKNGEAPPIQQNEVKVWADGKESTISQWQPLRDQSAGLEFVVLIDGSLRNSIGTQLAEMGKFIQAMPSGAAVGVAYMQQGSAVFAQGLTTDHELASKAVRLPGGVPGSNASPYFCLSDLAKRWPSQDTGKRREVVMITDGVDRYNLRYDPDNPYLQAAIRDSQRAGITVFSIYYRDMGRIDRTQYETNAGQNLLTQLTESTGGKLYWLGMGNPVSFQPYLEDIHHRLENQYEMGFTIPEKAKDLVPLKIKTSRGKMDVNAPQNVPVR